MNNSESSVAICSICNGPIGQGEPVVVYAGGAMAHRFSSTCLWHQEEDVKLMKELGITL